MLQGNVRAHGLFKVDSKGLYFYNNSELYKDIRDAAIQWDMNYYNSGTFAKDMQIKGWSDKEIKAEIKAVKAVIEAEYEDNRSTEKVTAVLNRTGSTGAGSYSNKKQTYAYYDVTGYWEETEQGVKGFWCEKAVAKEALVPNSVPMYNPYYVPLKKYDWITDTVTSQQYIKNMAAMIDGKYYAFNKNGNLITNSWIHDYEVFESRSNNTFDDEYQNYRFVGKDGTLTIDKWVKVDGIKRHLNKYGYMDINEWIAVKNHHNWLNSNGMIDLSRTNEEYKVWEKMVKYAKKYPNGTEVGVCSVLSNKLVKYLYGNNAKGKTYKYSWDKIKVGDTIAFSNYGIAHIGVVLEKNEETLHLVDANHGGDKQIHWGFTGFYKYFLDGNGDKDFKNFEYTTYY